MTETAACADIVLPATMFLEHDDIYTAGGHTHLQIGQKLIDAPGECRSNHRVLQELARRLGLSHPGFSLTEKQLIQNMLVASKLPDYDSILADGGYDFAPVEDFETSNFMSGFETSDKRFHFKPDWSDVGKHTQGMPSYPDHWDVIDSASNECPLRLVAAPARQFLNTSFTETASSRRMEKEPLARIHPEDMATYGIADGQTMTLGNSLGEVSLKAVAFSGVQVGTVVVESLWPNADFVGGVGINALVSSEPAQPNGGAAFHDTAVWVKGHSSQI
jgi:anaerobic selenocysteine-containing dehydrogenase